jgi:hypothetical protein
MCIQQGIEILMIFKNKEYLIIVNIQKSYLNLVY